ncbi:MAG: pyridoxal phosphate-dependent aminotransferase [Bacteroidota bacterium]
MFSSRTNWDFRSSQLFSLLQHKRERGEKIIDLTESNPTCCRFDYDSESILKALSTERSLVYEPDPKGLLSARLAVVDFYRDQGITIEPECIILTASTSEAYSFLFRLLCNERDSVLLPKPSYPLFTYLSQLNDASARHYHLSYDGEWHIDISALEQSFSGETRALVLVHPNNPTGSFVKVQEREAICKLAQRHHAALIVDEVFESFAFEVDGRRAPSFAGNSDVLTFTLNGLSKLLGLPQMKLAWIVISGPHDVRDEAIARLEMIGDIFLSVGAPVQHALALLLKDLLPVRQQIRDRVRSNYRMLKRECPPSSSLSVLRCEGGWNAILRLPNTRSDEEWALELLRTHNVLVHPGRLFDFEQKSCLVISLLPPSEIISEGFKRILGAAKT